jgi:uncharacterized protein (TIGR02588 family)
MNKNTLEWAVFALSLALIAGVAGLLLRQQFTGSHSPPSIAVTAGAAVATAGGFAVPLDVRNVGDTTAVGVTIDVSLRWEGGEERGEATLPYVPYRSRRRAWVVFRQDPRDGRLAARVLGYREP